MKKIAYVLSGQPRYVIECAENQNNLINYMRRNGYVVDIFAQSWDECEVMDSPTTMKKLTYKPKKIIKNIKQAYLPYRFKLESYVDVKSKIASSYSILSSKIKNLQGQHYAFINAVEMVPDDKYDIIFKSRYDMLCSSNLNGKIVARLKTEFGPTSQKIVAPNVRFSQSGFWNDVFFFGNSKLIKSAFNYNNLKNLQNIVDTLKSAGHHHYVENMFEGQNHVYAQLFTAMRNNRMNEEIGSIRVTSDEYKLYRYWLDGYDINDWDKIKHFHPTRPVDK